MNEWINQSKVIKRNGHLVILLIYKFLASWWPLWKNPHFVQQSPPPSPLSGNFVYICISVIGLISCGISQIDPISAGQRDIFVGWRAHLTYDLTFDIHFNIVVLIISYIRTIYIFCSYVRVYNAHMDNSYCKNIRLINIFCTLFKTRYPKANMGYYDVIRIIV